MLTGILVLSLNVSESLMFKSHFIVLAHGSPLVFGVRGEFAYEYEVGGIMVFQRKVY